MDYDYFKDFWNKRADMDKFHARDTNVYLRSVTDSSLDNSTSNSTYPDDTTKFTAKSWFNLNQDLLIGSALAIGGNLLISVSLNLQKYTHMRNERLGSESKHYVKSPIWWLGLTLMGLGELGNFSAYGFAPASLVAPLGTTTVVANMFIAVLFLKEKLRIEDLFGCTFAVIGAFLLVSFSQKDERILTAMEIEFLLIQPGFLVYVFTEIIAFIVLLVMYYRLKYANVLVVLLMTSLLASFTVISAKAVSSMLNITFSGNSQVQFAIFWIMLIIMIVTAVVQIKYLNIAMMSFNATIVVPTNFVFFTISAILAGIVLYQEFSGMSALEVFMFMFGCFLCFVGVYFITVGRATSTACGSADEDDPNAPKTQPRMSKVPKWIKKILPTWLFVRLPKTCVAEVDEDDETAIVGREEQNNSGSEDSLPMASVDSSNEKQPVTSVPKSDYGAVSQ